MADIKRLIKPSQASAAGAKMAGTVSRGFTPDERDAMKERAKELQAAARPGRAGGPDGETEVLAKIAEMQPSDRVMAHRLHAIIRASFPSLSPRTWYGMPAYAQDGVVVCFFRPAQKFKTRYATLGFSDKAKLDDGSLWATDFALTKLTAADEKSIAALVKRAVG